MATTNTPSRPVSPATHLLVTEPLHRHKSNSGESDISTFEIPFAPQPFKAGGFSGSSGASDDQGCQDCKRVVRLNRFLLSSLLILLILYLVIPVSRYFSEASSPECIEIPPEILDARLETTLPAHPTGEVAKRTTASRPNIIIPAYFPPEQADLWQKLFKAIAQYQTSVDFTIIVNPNNGPGTSAEVARYSATMNELNRYPNVKIVAYVHQHWGERSITSDIETWIRYFPRQLDGFFLDEMPSENTAGNLASVQRNHAFILSRPRSYFRGTGKPLIVQNPGTEVDVAFYKIAKPADITIVVENNADYLDTWNTSDRPSSAISHDNLGIIALDINDGELDSTVKMIASNVNSIFVSDRNADTAYLGVSNDFSNFVETTNKYRSLAIADSSQATATTSAKPKPTGRYANRRGRLNKGSSKSKTSTSRTSRIRTRLRQGKSP